MALFKNLFKRQAPRPASPQPAQYPPVPTQLPRIAAPRAALIAQTSNPSPAAQQILAANPQQTPAQYLSTLQERQMGEEMVKTVAHGMPDREGVWWASHCAGEVSDKLAPADVEAMQAAQAWAKNPTPATQAAAAAAAAKTDFQGPGAWAAQGAAWAQPTVPAATPAGTATAPRLAPHAVAGSVLLSAAMAATPQAAVPKVQTPALQAPAATQAPTSAAAQPAAPALSPAQQAQTFRAQHPFIALGLDVASGKNTWA
jgi:hypothetical protein